MNTLGSARKSVAKSKMMYQSPGTWAEGHCFYHFRLKILVQAGIGKWGKNNSKHFQRVVRGILKASKAAYWSLVFPKFLDFSVYMRVSQLGAIMDKIITWCMSQHTNDLWERRFLKGSFGIWNGIKSTAWFDCWGNYILVSDTFGKSSEKQVRCHESIADWLLIHWDQLFWASGSSGLSSWCVIRAKILYNSWL